MKKRVFVALPILKKLQSKIEEWKRKYQNLPVRWIKEENLHITLIPPWYITEAEKITNRLKSIETDVNPFKITFRKVEFGPDAKRPRLIWTSADSASEIIKSKSKLEVLLQQKSEKRSFLTHLTIARFREEDFVKFPNKILNDKVLWQEKVSSFILMESRLKRSGAEYEKLAEVPLNSSIL